MTYSQALEIAINAVSDAEASEKLTALKAQVEKKHTSSKPTKKQTENEVIKRNILDILAEGEAYTASQLASMLSTDEALITSQKVSALLRQMCVGEVVQKNTVKGKSMFSLA